MIHTRFTRVRGSGDVIRGDVRLAEGPPPRSAVLVVHGFKGFKDWGFFPHACARIAADGHAVVSFNLSHNGIGPDLETFSELELFAQNTLSLELDEVLWMLDQLLDEDLVPRPLERVGVLGHSRGGGQAILAAGEDSRVDALVTWAAVADFDRWTEDAKARWRPTGAPGSSTAAPASRCPSTSGCWTTSRRTATGSTSARRPPGSGVPG